MSNGHITMSTIPSALRPGVHHFANLAYENAEAVHKRLFAVINSTKNYEQFASVYGLSYMQQTNESGAHVGDSMGEGYRHSITPVQYSNGLRISHLAMINNQYESEMINKGKALGEAAARTEELVAMNVLNRAFNSSYAGGDGKELCATDHPTLAGTSANELAVAADISETSLEQCIKDIDGILDYRGNRTNLSAEKLIIPVGLKFDVRRILGSDLRVGTADNDLNALKDMQMFKDVVVSKYLTDADAFFIQTSIPKENGLIIVDREGLQIGQRNDDATRDVIFSAWRIFNAGFFDPNCVFGSPGA